MGMLFIIASRNGGLQRATSPIDERLIQASNIIVIWPDSQLAKQCEPQDHTAEHDSKQAPLLLNLNKDMQQNSRETKSFRMVKETSLILNLLNPKVYECFHKGKN